MLMCLWLSRTIPFPVTSGDRKYSTKLAGALAATGVAITFAGLGGNTRPEPMDNVEWYPVAGTKRGRIVSLMSMLPLDAARHSTPQYRAELRRLICSRAWDIIIIDSYGMSWVVPHVRLAHKGSRALVFVTHNHEESLTRQQWQETQTGVWQRLYLLQNYLKTRRIEHLTSRACDLITVHTEADAALFRRTAPSATMVTITPGYDGPRLSKRQITTSTSLAAVMFGSWRWSVKQANLRLFLDYADAKMHAAGIEMRIVGDIAASVRLKLEQQYVSARFTGFVQDLAPHFDVRLAIVAEPIGGGFKNKLLDFIFHRVPILALESCVVGLPASVQRHVLTAPDLSALIYHVETVIDDVGRLDLLQQGAFKAAEREFDWVERGRIMRAAVMGISTFEEVL